MNCRRKQRWVLGALMGAHIGCTNEIEPQRVELEVEVGIAYTLPATIDSEFASKVTLEYEFVESPGGSAGEIVFVEKDTPAFVAGGRGGFVVDRWIVIGASQRWTHRYVMEAGNALPVADIQGPETSRVGVPITLSGEGSIDTETDPLTFEWSFIRKPADSQVSILGESGETLVFTPDVAGNYEVKLRVFDGEEWAYRFVKHLVYVRS